MRYLLPQLTMQSMNAYVYPDFYGNSSGISLAGIVSMTEFFVLQLLEWIALGMFQMVCWALITDVIDYSEIKNGIREDGSVYALYSFARKLGQALAAGVSGWLLTAIGYNENAASMGIAQTESSLFLR